MDVRHLLGDFWFILRDPPDWSSLAHCVESRRMEQMRVYTTYRMLCTCIWLPGTPSRAHPLDGPVEVGTARALAGRKGRRRTGQLDP